MAWDTVIACAVRAVKALDTINPNRRIDRVRIENALQSLRQIFFYSSELKSTLEDIEAGREVDPETVDFFATEFSDLSPRVQDALSFLDISRFEDRNVLLIRDMDLLNDVRRGKINTRALVSSFFKEYAAARPYGRERFVEQAARVIGQIERLNTEIHKLEAKLIAAQKGAPLPATPRAAPRSRRRPIDSEDISN